MPLVGSLANSSNMSEEDLAKARQAYEILELRITVLSIASSDGWPVGMDTNIWL